MAMHTKLVAKVSYQFYKSLYFANIRFAYLLLRPQAVFFANLKVVAYQNNAIIQSNNTKKGPIFDEAI